MLRFFVSVRFVCLQRLRFRGCAVTEAVIGAHPPDENIDHALIALIRISRPDETNRPFQIDEPVHHAAQCAHHVE